MMHFYFPEPSLLPAPAIWFSLHLALSVELKEHTDLPGANQSLIILHVWRGDLDQSAAFMDGWGWKLGLTQQKTSGRRERMGTPGWGTQCLIMEAGSLPQRKRGAPRSGCFFLRSWRDFQRGHLKTIVVVLMEAVRIHEWEMKARREKRKRRRKLHPT